MSNRERTFCELCWHILIRSIVMSLLMLQWISFCIVTIMRGSRNFPSLPLSCVPPLPLPFPRLLFRLQVGSPLNQLGGLGNAVSSPAGSGADLVHSKAAIKTLVAIILSIPKCTFYSRTIKSWHQLTWPRVYRRCAVTCQQYSDGVALLRPRPEQHRLKKLWNFEARACIGLQKKSGFY